MFSHDGRYHLNLIAGKDDVDEIVIRALEGRASASELEELERWRQASADHERRYQELRAVWVLTGVRKEIEPREGRPRATDLLGAAAGADRHRSEEGPEEEGAVRSGSHSRRWVPQLAAAAVVLLLGGTLAVHFAESPEPVVETAHFQAGPNELETAVLDDGSVVRLAPGTSLEVTMASDEREAWLDGRAFFVVSHDADRPFRVRSAAGDARVLGTRFEADTRREGLRLLVVEGRVALGARDGEAELGAGQLGQASGEEQPSVMEVEAPEALLEWMGAWMAFESTPLTRVAEELEVRLGIEVELEDPAVRDRTVSGWFAEEEQDEMISMICRVADLDCAVEGDVLRIGG